MKKNSLKYIRKTLVINVYVVIFERHLRFIRCTFGEQRRGKSYSSTLISRNESRAKKISFFRIRRDTFKANKPTSVVCFSMTKNVLRMK